MYNQMVLVRRFEERILELFSEGMLSGTTHASIGQEADAVAVINHLAEGDIVVSNHRCHGHYLVRTGDVVGLMAELMGKADGVCGGRGGSQHLCADNFFTNGVQGNMAPVAAGMAYAEKAKASGAVVVLFLGDGTFGQGTVYEAFNMMSLWSLPVLVVVEDNGYAQTTPLRLAFAGSFEARAQAFGMTAGEIESTDVEVLYKHFGPLVERVRRDSRPHMEVIHTYRLCAHSKGDDFRPVDEINNRRKLDPLTIAGEHLGLERVEVVEGRIRAVIREAEQTARAMQYPRWTE